MGHLGRLNGECGGTCRQTECCSHWLRCHGGGHSSTRGPAAGSTRGGAVCGVPRHGLPSSHYGGCQHAQHARPATDSSRHAGEAIITETPHLGNMELVALCLQRLRDNPGFAALLTPPVQEEHCQGLHQVRPRWLWRGQCVVVRVTVHLRRLENLTDDLLIIQLGTGPDGTVKVNKLFKCTTRRLDEIEQAKQA
ncbi:hypothetical protein HPB50_027701 [Hyalomma asiaticum]|nr:hypothetical protein HPB50_027701 [Hyalomma asiaticum]